jgi:hypothetical protein
VRAVVPVVAAGAPAIVSRTAGASGPVCAVARGLAVVSVAGVLVCRGSRTPRSCGQLCADLDVLSMGVTVGARRPTRSTRPITSAALLKVRRPGYGGLARGKSVLVVLASIRSADAPVSASRMPPAVAPDAGRTAWLAVLSVVSAADAHACLVGCSERASDVHRVGACRGRSARCCVRRRVYG